MQTEVDPGLTLSLEVSLLFVCLEGIFSRGLDRQVNVPAFVMDAIHPPKPTLGIFPVLTELLNLVEVQNHIADVPEERHVVLGGRRRSSGSCN